MKRKAVLIGYILLLTAAAASGSGIENNRRGVEALHAGRFNEAIAYLSEAHRELPDNETVKNNLAAAYNNAALDLATKGDFESARTLMKKAYQLEPDAVNVRQNLAHLLTNESYRRYNEKRDDGIVELLTESLGYDPTLAQTRVLLGQLYYERDDYAQAQEQWKKALQADPSLADVQTKLTKLEREMVDDYRRQDQQKFHFKVRYEGSELWNASREVLDMLEDAYAETGRKFGIFPDRMLTVIIYTQEKFQSVSGSADWIAGVYDGKIRLRRSDVEGNRDRLRQIVYHEYLHALIHFIAGNNVPVWLNEGIAQCYETMPRKPDLSAAERYLLKERLANNPPSPEQINALFLSQDSPAGVQFAYAYAKAFVGYLLDRGWDYNIKNLLEELKKGSAIDDAFDRIYFRNVEMMRRSWLYDRNDTTPF